MKIAKRITQKGLTFSTVGTGYRALKSDICFMVQKPGVVTILQLWYCKNIGIPYHTTQAPLKKSK